MREVQGATSVHAGAFARRRAAGRAPGISMRIRFNLRRRRSFAPFWAALALAGCATPPIAVAPAPVAARLAVVNLTPYAWRIAVAPAAGGEARVVRIEPRGTAELELPGGDYRIEQAILASAEQPEATRRFPARLDAGQTYRWPLATLMSEAEDDGDARTKGGKR